MLQQEQEQQQLTLIITWPLVVPNGDKKGSICVHRHKHNSVTKWTPDSEWLAPKKLTLVKVR